MALRGRKFFIKLFNWEYWPFGIIHIPLVLMWLWYSLRERSFFYFSASNPGILSGGMMGESKYEVLSLIADTLKPKTILIKLPVSTTTLETQLLEAGLAYPLIFKPDLGERGWMVRKINNPDEAQQYLSEIKIPFIVQQWIDLPLEFGVYYVRFPNEEKGVVNSITGKEFLSVYGDGKKKLSELILENSRAILQWEVLKKKYQFQLDRVLTEGEKIELVSIGNHCLGTAFINANQYITPMLNESFDRISRNIPGFYFGRYDLRCASIEELEKGNVKIVELNGCGAEPSHIYHPNASLWKGVADLIRHWKNLYRISRENHLRGVPYLSFREGISIYKKCKALQR
ncbi:MAG: hypothetical protein JSS93_05120 [Bacteroidetes bacterium]|nr:hypothetical protein [Bacteroidota bacterium]